MVTLFDDLFDRVMNKYPKLAAKFHTLKPEQRIILKYILIGESVVCQLNTGYGKTLICVLAPLLMDEV